jgi:hypothetical protein
MILSLDLIFAKVWPTADRFAMTFPLVIAGVDPAIHAEKKAHARLPLANDCITSSWTTGTSPVVTT